MKGVEFIYGEDNLWSYKQKRKEKNIDNRTKAGRMIEFLKDNADKRYTVHELMVMFGYSHNCAVHRALTRSGIPLTRTKTTLIQYGNNSVGSINGKEIKRW